jgi:hypothetical protein
MGGVGARFAAWPEAGAAFSLLAPKPAPHKSAVAIIIKKDFPASRMTESPDLNFAE